MVVSKESIDKIKFKRLDDKIGGPDDFDKEDLRRLTNEIEKKKKKPYY